MTYLKAALEPTQNNGTVQKIEKGQNLGARRWDLPKHNQSPHDMQE
jgi:hypothetical protein